MIEVTSTLFRRLVKSYLAVLLISVATAGFELWVYPGWDFSNAFDRLAAAYFDPVISDDVWLLAAAALLLVHLSGAIGLLRFKRWGRELFVWSVVILTIADVALLSRPVPFTPLMSLLSFIASALFGALLLMLYSPEHGGTWLQRRAEPPIRESS